VKEVNLMRRIMLAASRAGATIWRNNAGVARYPDGSVVRYGVANPGGSDLIGLRTIEVTPDMVGRKVAVFIAIEVKTPSGRLTDDQRRFLDFVRAAGGIGIVARSEDDLAPVVSGHIRKSQ
jgi:hypothetical protein